MLKRAAMTLTPISNQFRYFPAIVCSLCDSPIDALLALCVPRDEAMDLVTASWREASTECLVTTLTGGRPIAVIHTPDGRWAACNAFLDELYETPQEAHKKLGKLLKRGRQGCVGYIRCLPGSPLDQQQAHRPIPALQAVALVISPSQTKTANGPKL